MLARHSFTSAAALLAMASWISACGSNVASGGADSMGVGSTGGGGSGGGGAAGGTGGSEVVDECEVDPFLCVTACNGGDFVASVCDKGFGWVCPEGSFDPEDCPTSECCTDDIQCGDVAYSPCVNGVCKEHVDGQCWKDEECPSGTSCIDVSVCPCGESCDTEDVPGFCEGPP
jgi:hypothetical protein